MVDTTLDKLIKQAVEESNKIVTPAVVDGQDIILKPAKLLSDIPCFFIGDKNMQSALKERIVFGRANNTKDSEGFDFEQRKLTFYFHLQIKDTTDYISVLDRLNQIENALIQTLIYSTILSGYNDSETMSIDDIKPYYQPDEDDNIIFQTEEMYVSFNVEEDYSKPSTVYDSIKIRGEVENGN